MVSQVIKDTFLNVYKDDYRDSDNYYKILFNNGRSLQQRELNQLQTIINKDIQASGEFLFKPGAAVTGGTPSDETRVNFIKIVSFGISDLTKYENTVFREETSNLLIRIERAVAATGSDPNTIYVTYEGNNNASSTEQITATPGRVLSYVSGNDDLIGESLTVTSTDTSANPATGFGVIYTVDAGRFFIDGHYIYSDAQSIILSKYSTQVTTTVGWKVTESIVTVTDDENLYDNSGANLNISAPGADRYKITLTLTTSSLVDSDDYFIPLAKIEDGALISELNALDGSGSRLNTIIDIMELRQHATNGNFTVETGEIRFEDDPDDNSKFKVAIPATSAFVNGKLVSTKDTSRVTHDKPRTTLTAENQASTVTFGNYVIVDNLNGIFDIENFEEINIYDAITAGGSVRGTAKVRSIDKFGSNYRVYLFEVEMDGGYNFSAMRSIGNSATDYADIKLEAGVAKIYGQSENNLFMPLPNTRPASVYDLVLTVQRVNQVTDGDNDGTISFSATSGYAFDDTSSWIIVRTDTGAVVTGTITPVGTPATSVSITGLPTGTLTFRVLNYQLTTGTTGQVKSKTLQTNTESSVSLTAGSLDLAKTDIYQLTSVTRVSDSVDITDEFIFDNGQRDNFYDVGNIRLKGGSSVSSTETVTVVYSYFLHSGNGNCFAVDSYSGQIDYEDIPVHRQKNGEIINLRNVLDFRPSRTPGGSTFAEIFHLPQNGDNVTFDADFYLGVRGKVYVSDQVYVGAKLGEPALDPKFPTLPKSVMPLAEFTINPYMLDNEDLKLKYIENKRYTMKDIAVLDKRIDTLEELTSLSFLELSATNKQILDSDGLDRLKSGITADNFKDHYQSDIYITNVSGQTTERNPEYKAAIDFIRGEVNPRTLTRNLDLVFDSADAGNSNVIRKGDTIMLDYTETEFKFQSSFSRAIVVAPQALPTFIGRMELSPSGDAWVDTEVLAKKVIIGEDRISADPLDTHNWHTTGWNGIKTEDLAELNEGDVAWRGETTTELVYQSFGEDQDKVVKKNTPIFKLKNSVANIESLGNKIRAISLIPTMRSRFISFKVTGLKPSTRHYFFFDGVDVNDWVFSSTGIGEFTRFAELPTNDKYHVKGNVWYSLTEFPSTGEYPGKTSAHYTSSAGEISGYFLIPNTASISFDTGQVFLQIAEVSTYSAINSAAFSKAEVPFSATGLIKSIQEEELRTRTYYLESDVETTGNINLYQPVSETIEGRDGDDP